MSHIANNNAGLDRARAVRENDVAQSTQAGPSSGDGLISKLKQHLQNVVSNSNSGSLSNGGSGMSKLGTIAKTLGSFLSSRDSQGNKAPDRSAMSRAFPSSSEESAGLIDAVLSRIDKADDAEWERLKELLNFSPKNDGVSSDELFRARRQILFLYALGMSMHEIAYVRVLMGDGGYNVNNAALKKALGALGRFIL